MGNTSDLYLAFLRKAVRLTHSTRELTVDQLLLGLFTVHIGVSVRKANTGT